MNIHYFATGGFVAHGCRVAGSPMRFSAWFDPNGVLLNAESFDATQRARPVSPSQRQALARQGRAYIAAATLHLTSQEYDA